MSENLKILKICPLASELSSVNNSIKCKEEGCNSIFTSESNLNMHMLKCHKKEKLKKNEENVIYHHHCPDTDCVYHTIQHFKKMKYLKQHYLKVHAKKCFICDTCHKGFPTQAIKNTHSEICGIKFTCLSCTKRYNSYESLVTHGRRKHHLIPEKSVFINKVEDVKPLPSKNKLILPKQTTSMQTIQFIPIVLQVKEQVERHDKEIQTEPCIKTKIKPVKRRANIYTQTCTKKRTRISTETQTTGDCILKKAIQDSKLSLNVIVPNELVRKSSETQTKTDVWGENSSTQTHTDDLKSDSTITLGSVSSDDIITSSSQSVNSLTFFEDTFGNCQETQTDLAFDDDFLHSSNYISHIETQTNNDLDLCSNIDTQTCDDQMLSYFGFSNIQTQTTWPDYDLFVSTETQTLLTQNTKTFFDLPISGREISHMETQTDMEFKQLLEEINA